MTENRITTHGSAQREMTRASLAALMGQGDPGKFGRMFPELDPLKVHEDALLDLANAMVDAQPNSVQGDNAAIPAGFTYLGQFVDHDITLDTTPLQDREVDPLAVTNFRTPALDLDSLYGQGPTISPYLYQRRLSFPAAFGAKFIIGTATESAVNPAAPNGAKFPDLPNDLPRNALGLAIIGDERNDENLLVAQTHLAMMKFHNKVVDWVSSRSPSLSPEKLFEEARRLVTWHYQWIVLFDFVERLVGRGTINKIRENGRQFYRFKTRPYMPAEFSVAAYRLGHSMVREVYDHNSVFKQGGVTPATLGLLFTFTGKSGNIVGGLSQDPTLQSKFPQGQVPLLKTLPSNWVIDWRRFYDFGSSTPTTVPVNLARRLDPFITPALHQLPGPPGPMAILPFRNLLRGVRLELPSGQAVAKAISAAPLSSVDLSSGPDGAALKAHNLTEATPLWYYILKEAQVQHGGARLGAVGSVIVAETFLGLVHGDQKSFLWQRKNWQPELPRADEGHFTMVDLLNFVGDINPLGTD